MATLLFYKTHPDIIIPEFATKQSACFDLAFQVNGKLSYFGFNENNKPFERPFRKGVELYIGAKERILVPTGLIMDIPLGYSVRLHPRSGTSYKQGLVLANAEGVIDSDYIDETFLLMYNMSNNGHIIPNGTRLAQGELIELVKYDIEETSKAPKKKSNRKGGMGSTGVTINVETTSNTENTSESADSNPAG